MIQGEWNIVKMGNPSHLGKCRRARFKNLFIETTDLTTNEIESVAVMTNFIINASIDHLKMMQIKYIQDNMSTMIDYGSSTLEFYRSFVYDAIMLYGFVLENSSTDVLKARFQIEDGLSQWGFWSDFSRTSDELIQTRTRTCSLDPENLTESLSEQKSCQNEGCSIWISIDAADTSRNSEAGF